MTSPLTGHIHSAFAGWVIRKKAMRRGSNRRIGRPYERFGRPRGAGWRDGAVRYSEVSARYSAFALVPVREATTVAAFRGWAPASTSWRRDSTARGSGASDEEPAAGGPITSTISP